MMQKTEGALDIRRQRRQRPLSSWLWVKMGIHLKNPSKWNQTLKPAVYILVLFGFDPKPALPRLLSTALQCFHGLVRLFLGPAGFAPEAQREEQSWLGGWEGRGREPKWVWLKIKDLALRMF